MKKQFRIKKNEEFQKILHRKKFFASSAFVIYFKPKAKAHARVGISVPKKIGNAVVRNKCKRQIRMMVIQNFDFSSDKDVIIIVRLQYLKNSYHENEAMLCKLLNTVARRTHEQQN